MSDPSAEAGRSERLQRIEKQVSEMHTAIVGNPADAYQTGMAPRLVGCEKRLNAHSESLEEHEEDDKEYRKAHAAEHARWGARAWGLLTTAMLAAVGAAWALLKK